MVRLTLGEVRDGSGDPRGGPGRVEGPSGSSGTGRGTLGEVWDGSRDPRGVPEMGRGTLGEVRDGSVDPQKSLGRVAGPSLKSGTGRETFIQFQDRPGDPWGGPVLVEKHSGRY